MNSITPNLLEKFSQEFIFPLLSLTQTAFIHLFFPLLLYLEAPWLLFPLEDALRLPGDVQATENLCDEAEDGTF